MNKMQIRVSNLGIIYKCPRAFYINYIAEKKPEALTTAPLEIGTIFHRLHEEYNLNNSSEKKENYVTELINNNIDKSEIFRNSKDKSEYDKFCNFFKYNKEDDKISFENEATQSLFDYVTTEKKLDIILCEQELHHNIIIHELQEPYVPILDLSITGHIDYFLKGGILMDLKFIAKKEDTQVLINRYKNNMFFYIYLLQKNYIFPQQCILRCYTKTKKTKMFDIEIPFSDEDMKGVEKKLYRLAKTIRMWSQEFKNEPWPNNYNDYCRICSYANDCQGISIYDMPDLEVDEEFKETEMNTNQQKAVGIFNATFNENLKLKEDE